MVKQSNTNSLFATGAQRDDRKGKLCFSLLPHEELKRVMKRYTEGAETYGRNNWIKGMPMSNYYDSAMRHMTSFWQCKNDEDHLAAAVWNILSMMYTENHNQLLDDRKDYPID
jgi:hypothetical protein